MISSTTKIRVRFAETDAMGLHLPVLEVGAKYLRSAHFDDTLEIRASIRERPGVVIKIEYEVFCGEKKLCEAFSRHAFVNEKGVPIKPPAEFLKKLRALFDKNE